MRERERQVKRNLSGAVEKEDLPVFSFGYYWPTLPELGCSLFQEVCVPVLLCVIQCNE